MVITREMRDEIELAVSKAVSESIKREINVKEIISKVTQAITKTISDSLSNLEKAVAELKNKTEAENKKLQDKVGKLEQEMKEVVKKTNIYEEKLDYMDQNTRLSNLRVFNLNESQEEPRNEIKNLFQSKMAITLRDEDINLCYRIGKKNDEKPRGIFIKLRSLDLKQNVYSKKKLLKGTGVVIREDLTKTRVQLLNDSIEKFGLKNVWTENGKIYINHNNKVTSIRNKIEFSKVSI
ncbi:unnamed protein product [Phaedon cochleariae]|uniref:Uncharacterized protein n=1 Tax=Phaedon cochleariae TaxID=80249 RepID=A0A9N9SIC4_PHACE|nr:unnamed protein product [Phaedon cochleariae]